MAEVVPAGEAQRGGLAALLPGVGLAIAVATAALALARLEESLFGRAWLEGLVLAILLGAFVRSWRRPGPAFMPGIRFSAHALLELAIVLLGASLDLAALVALGPGLLLGIVLTVALAVPAGFLVARLTGLPRELAWLVACGNAICGNSAIAAAAPVVGAKGDEVAGAIGYTAVLGVVVVLGLPLLVPLLGLSPTRYGVLAGLTVYAVPQVLAATAPVAAVSLQLGTLVKLVRVLMLGPVVLALSLLHGRRAPGGLAARRLVPWFIIGFLVMAGLRALHLLPAGLLPGLADGANLLTIVAMAGLGLCVDVRTVARSGARLAVAATLSLLVLCAISLALTGFLGLA